MNRNFLDTPKRSDRPREHGLTSLIDNGVPTRYFVDVIESNAHLIDAVKFGWGTALVTKDLEKKIECLAEHEVKYYFGGTLFEKALSQKKLDAFYKFLKQHNCEIMEVSDGTLHIPSKDKARHIADFSKEFYVLSEVGKKDVEQADNMMSSCCTLRLKRRSAFSRDSPSWSLTSAKLTTPPNSSYLDGDSYCKVLPSSQELCQVFVQGPRGPT